MAHLKKGILGTPKGKIGSIHGSNWKGVSRLVSNPTSSRTLVGGNLTQNGINLLEIAEVYSACKSILASILESNLPGVLVNYNQLVKSGLMMFGPKPDLYISPMWLESDQFKSKMHFSNPWPFLASHTAIGLQNLFSIKSMYNDAEIKKAVLSNFPGSASSTTVSISANQMYEGFNLTAPAGTYPVVQLTWVESALSGLISQIGVTMRVLTI